jgi:hypothetical protein
MGLGEPISLLPSVVRSSVWTGWPSVRVPSLGSRNWALRQHGVDPGRYSGGWMTHVRCSPMFSMH